MNIYELQCDTNAANLSSVFCNLSWTYVAKVHTLACYLMILLVNSNLYAIFTATFVVYKMHVVEKILMGDDIYDV